MKWRLYKKERKEGDRYEFSVEKFRENLHYNGIRIMIYKKDITFLELYNTEDLEKHFKTTLKTQNNNSYSILLNFPLLKKYKTKYEDRFINSSFSNTYLKIGDGIYLKEIASSLSNGEIANIVKDEMHKIYSMSLEGIDALDISIVK